MKTMKQVLAEFQRMQKQLICDGSVDVRVYCNGKYWTVSVEKMTFTHKNEIETHDWVEWTHYSCQDEVDEQENEAKLAAFKEKLNLK